MKIKQCIPLPVTEKGKALFPDKKEKISNLSFAEVSNYEVSSRGW